MNAKLYTLRVIHLLWYLTIILEWWIDMNCIGGSLWSFKWSCETDYNRKFKFVWLFIIYHIFKLNRIIF